MGLTRSLTAFQLSGWFLTDPPDLSDVYDGNTFSLARTAFGLLLSVRPAGKGRTRQAGARSAHP
jgi:hypothetical protein